MVRCCSGGSCAKLPLRLSGYQMPQRQSGLRTVRRGRPDEALAVVQESLRHIRELQDKFAFVYALIPLAAAAVLKGDDEWAARILGARDAATERTGATVVDRSLDDRTDLSESGVRARLGPRRWALAYTAGRSASIDALLEDIEAVGAASPHPVA